VAEATAAARARMRVRAPLLAASAAAWLVLAARAAATGSDSPHGMHSAHGPALSLVAEAAVMLAAMMAPLLEGPLGHVLGQSLARRRRRAVALFLVSYALPWSGAAVVLLALAEWLAVSAPRWALPLAVLGAALFQASPLKQRCLNRGHRHRALAAFGAPADLAVVRFGVSHAAWCIGSCSALMLVPMLAPHCHLAAMGGVALWLVGERLEEPAVPRWRWHGPVKLARFALSTPHRWLGRLQPDAPSTRAFVMAPGSWRR
jgi:predicted metal-binding membrane protein